MICWYSFLDFIWFPDFFRIFPDFFQIIRFNWFCPVRYDDFIFRILSDFTGIFSKFSSNILFCNFWLHRELIEYCSVSSVTIKVNDPFICSYNKRCNTSVNQFNDSSQFLFRERIFEVWKSLFFFFFDHCTPLKSSDFSGLDYNSSHNW